MAILCSECGAQVKRPVVTGRGPMLCTKCEAKKNGPQSDDENMPTMDAPPPAPSAELERPPHSEPHRALAGAPTRPMPSRPPRASQPPRNYSAPAGPRIPMGSTPPPRAAPRPSTFPLAPGSARPSQAPPASATAPAPPPVHASAPAPARAAGPAIPRPGALPSGMPATRSAPSPARRPAPGPPTDHERSSEFDPVGTGEFEVLPRDDDGESLGTGDIEIEPPPRPKKR